MLLHVIERDNKPYMKILNHSLQGKDLAQGYKAGEPGFEPMDQSPWSSRTQWSTKMRVGRNTLAMEKGRASLRECHGKWKGATSDP